MEFRISVIFVSLLVSNIAFGQECNSDRQRICKSVVLAELKKYNRDLSSRDLEIHCRSIGQNLNCMVRQLIQCSKVEGKERNDDTIPRGWKHMQQICSSYYSWWHSKCFHKNEVKQCENFFTVVASSVTENSCQGYGRFRDCMLDVMKNHCDSEDKTVMGIYLLDKGKELVWKCPLQEQTAETTHEKFSAYTSGLTIDSPFSSGCNARATEEMRGCLDRLQYERDQSLSSRDEEERLRKSCCATWNYRRCHQSAVRSHCFDFREIESAPTIDGVGHDRDYRCKEHWIYTCSGSFSITSSAVFVLALILISINYGLISNSS